MEKCTSEHNSEIQDFYEGRSVFITGASGYIGSILLEQLLRLCPGLAEIFILLRGKKGSTPDERKEQILRKPIFWKLKKDSPEVLEKVHLVSGEITQENAGVSPEDLEKLKENVSIVFHCAASISFSKELSFMLMNNVVGTYNIISLCKKLPKIAAFVHTSTAFSNCHFDVIKEEIFRIPLPLDKIIEATKSGDETFIRALEKDHGRKWYNIYTFTKSIGENVVAQEALNIPTAIVRPSVVSHVWKGSLPGYIEPGTSFADAIYAVMTGFTQVVLLDENKKVDSIPSDIVANTLMAAAWNVAKKRVENPLVLNCTSSNTVSLKWKQFFDAFLNRPYSVFCPNTFRTPKIIYTHSFPEYFLMSFFYHQIPAYFADLFLALFERKVSLRKLYEIQDKGTLSTGPFLLNEFRFESANFDNLKYLLNETDREIFNTDLAGYNFQYIAENCAVNEAFQFKTDDTEVKLKQAALAERIAMFTELYKCLLMLILFTLAWFLLKLIFRNLI